MHTIKTSSGAAVNHNSDWSGDAIVIHEGREIVLPASVFVDVAAKIAEMSRADADDDAQNEREMGTTGKAAASADSKPTHPAPTDGALPLWKGTFQAVSYTGPRQAVSSLLGHLGINEEIPRPAALRVEEVRRGRLVEVTIHWASLDDKGPDIVKLDTSPEKAPLAEHPAPWRWDETHGRLDAADDTSVLWASNADGDADVQSPSPGVRELIRLAPDLEAALRKVEWSGENPRSSAPECCPECRSVAPLNTDFPGEPHKATCSIGTLLDALDAARKDPK